MQRALVLQAVAVLFDVVVVGGGGGGGVISSLLMLKSIDIFKVKFFSRFFSIYIFFVTISPPKKSGGNGNLAHLFVKTKNQRCAVWEEVESTSGRSQNSEKFFELMDR